MGLFASGQATTRKSTDGEQWQQNATIQSLDVDWILPSWRLRETNARRTTRDQLDGSPTGLAVQHCAAADIVSKTATLPVALVKLRFARRLAQRLAVTVVAGIYAAVRHCPRLCDDGGPI